MKRRDFLAAASLLFLSACATKQKTSIQPAFNAKPLEPLDPIEPIEPLETIANSITLTIDDGPGPLMSNILATLGTGNPTIFYMQGKRMHTKSGFYNTCKAIEQGHLIGNHTYDHPCFSHISTSEAKSQIDATDFIIQKAYATVGIPRPAKLFRYTYGDPGDGTFGLSHPPKNKKRIEIANHLAAHGYKVQFWTLDCEDWKHYSTKNYLDADSIMSNCRAATKGDIVLCHENSFTASMIVPFYAQNSNYRLSLRY